MTRFHSRETIDAPLDHVVAWHSLPGALTRLSPHWAQEVEKEGVPTVPGTRAQMKISVPGSHGTVRVPWTAEHFALADLPPFAQAAGQAERGELGQSGAAEAGFGDRMPSGSLTPFSSFEHRHVFRAAADAAQSGTAETDHEPGAEASASALTEIEDTLDFTLRGGHELRFGKQGGSQGDEQSDDAEVSVLDTPRTHGGDASSKEPSGRGRSYWSDLLSNPSSFDLRAFGADVASNVERIVSRIPGASSAARSVGGGIEDRFAVSLDQTFGARTRRLEQEFEFLRSIDAPTVGGTRTLNVLVTGSSGLVGAQLSALLTTAGHRVRALVRRKPRPELSRDASSTDTAPPAGTASSRTDSTGAAPFDERPLTESTWEPSLGLVQPEDLAWADVVVHLAGRSIGGRLTESAKKEIRSSRIDSTRLLVDTIGSLPEEQRPEAFVCASAVGYYGTDRREPVAEDSAPGDGFLAQVCAEWETEAARAEELGLRRVSVRTGLVMSSLGGLLKMQLPLYLAAGGGPLGSGEQWFPWISHDDMVRVYARAVTDVSLSGPVNAVAPGIVTQKQWATALGRHLRRPAVVPVPRVGPALLLSEEGADELALAGQRAVPAALESAGFEFAHRSLEECFEEELGPRGF